MALNARLSTILTASAMQYAAHGTQATLPGFDIAISFEDLTLWIDTVAPHISESRRPGYIRDYHVADKVRRAKLAGQWPPVKAWID